MAKFGLLSNETFGKCHYHFALKEIIWTLKNVYESLTCGVVIVNTTQVEPNKTTTKLQTYIFTHLIISL